jgi:3-phosphoshikimate 1-carboxyvinyltransferase
MRSTDLPRVARAEGRIALPGSKSLSNRALLLAALARGTTRLEGVLESDDTRVMRDALAALGIAVDPAGDATRLDVHGAGFDQGFPEKRAEIFLGNSGTSARMLTAVLAFADGHYRLSGVPRMHERPIGDLADAPAPGRRAHPLPRHTRVPAARDRALSRRAGRGT